MYESTYFVGACVYPRLFKWVCACVLNQGHIGSNVQLLHEAVADVHNLPQEPSFNCIHTFCKKESCIFICKLHLIVPQLQLIIRWRFRAYHVYLILLRVAREFRKVYKQRITPKLHS